MNKTSDYDQLHHGTEAPTPRHATASATRQGRLSDRVISMIRPSATPIFIILIVLWSWNEKIYPKLFFLLHLVRLSSTGSVTFQSYHPIFLSKSSHEPGYRRNCIFEIKSRDFVISPKEEIITWHVFKPLLPNFHRPPFFRTSLDTSVIWWR